jgi:hypothetical protein
MREVNTRLTAAVYCRWGAGGATESVESALTARGRPCIKHRGKSAEG